jgi:hypothetical protein
MATEAKADKPFNEEAYRAKLRIILAPIRDRAVRERVIRGAIARMRRDEFKLIKGGRAGEQSETLRGECNL